MEKQKEKEERGKNKGREGVEREKRQERMHKAGETRRDGNLELHTEMGGRSSACAECISLWSESKSELSQESLPRI